MRDHSTRKRSPLQDHALHALLALNASRIAFRAIAAGHDGLWPAVRRARFAQQA